MRVARDGAVAGQAGVEALLDPMIMMEWRLREWHLRKGRMRRRRREEAHAHAHARAHTYARACGLALS
jgi:hypothetical protein